MARTNTVALPIGWIPSNMVEVCSLPLGAMFTTQAPEMQWVFVAIKQLWSNCSQTQLKSSIAGSEPECFCH